MHWERFSYGLLDLRNIKKKLTFKLGFLFALCPHWFLLFITYFFILFSHFLQEKNPMKIKETSIFDRSLFIDINKFFFISSSTLSSFFLLYEILKVGITLFKRKYDKEWFRCQLVCFFHFVDMMTCHLQCIGFRDALAVPYHNRFS